MWFKQTANLPTATMVWLRVYSPNISCAVLHTLLFKNVHLSGSKKAEEGKAVFTSKLLPVSLLVLTDRFNVQIHVPCAAQDVGKTIAMIAARQSRATTPPQVFVPVVSH